jgi:hypothetical protein
MAGYVPAWAAFLIGFLVFLCVGLPLGAYVGWAWGAEHERAAAEAELEAEAAVRSMRPAAPVYLDTISRTRAEWPPEVTHDWAAHEASALAIANADKRSDEEWMADEFAKLHAYTTSLLNEHPATEDL